MPVTVAGKRERQAGSMENQKLISLQQYLQLQEVQNQNEEVQHELPSFEAEVFDFSIYQARANEKRDRFVKAKQRAYAILNVVKGLVQDYEIDMARVAADCDREQYVSEYGHDPETQIQDDMRRLCAFADWLGSALDSDDANNLIEACGILRQAAPEEVVETLNYILVSEYDGFRAIKTLIEAGRLTEEAYLENTEAFYQLWNEIAQAALPHSLDAIAALCCDQAVAI